MIMYLGAKPRKIDRIEHRRNMGSDKKHFVLVHGSCHGAWCWYKLVPLLKMAGHSVTALDLGGGGVNPKRLDEIASISDHLQPLMDFMTAVPQDQKVILVGHSYGGFAISLAMESFPEKIAVAVFVAAFMPNFQSPPASIMQQYFKSTPVDSSMDAQLLFDRGQENPPTSIFMGPNLLETKAYNRCQLEDLELAKMLVRRSGMFLEELGEESVLTEGKFGSLSRVYVVSEGDQLVSAEYQRWVIENSPPKEVMSIARADHMVMLSKPKELSVLLLEIADKYH